MWAIPTLPNPSGLDPGLSPVPRVDRDTGKGKQTMCGYHVHTHTAPRANPHPLHPSLLQTPVVLLRHNYHLCEWLRGHFAQNIWKVRIVLVPQDELSMLEITRCMPDGVEWRRQRAEGTRPGGALSMNPFGVALGVESLWAAPRGLACSGEGWLEAPKQSQCGNECSASLPEGSRHNPSLSLVHHLTTQALEKPKWPWHLLQKSRKLFLFHICL